MEEGKEVVNKFIKNPDQSSMDELIDVAVSDKLTNSDIADLAYGMAKSGKILAKKKEFTLADIPSTGGPSSLTTLLCPLVLVENGFVVPKLGVKGRPAGGIDVLYQIPGYNINPSQIEIENSLESARYCHFIVNEDYAPLDAKLFKYRSKVGAKAIPSLVIASILSKKIVAGLNFTGLDVRVAPFGNFGTNMVEAKLNSKKFIDVANISGIKAICFLSDFTVVQQPFIGRGESLVALDAIFSNEMDYLLKKHLYYCIGMSNSLSPDKVLNISHKKLALNFELNLISQGTNIEQFKLKVNEVKKGHINSITSDKQGFLSIDLMEVRELIVKFQEKDSASSLFPDTCGIIFKKTSNDYIFEGDTICTYRVKDVFLKDFKKEMSSIFSIQNLPHNTEQFKFIEYGEI